jgi:hypothetical protein
MLYEFLQVEMTGFAVRSDEEVSQEEEVKKVS